MNRDIIDRVISALETLNENDDKKLFSATILLIGILQESSAYKNLKARPVVELRKAISEIQGLDPFRWTLNGSKPYDIAEGIVATRFINEENRQYLEIDPLFNYELKPVEDDDENSYIDREEFRELLSAETEFETFFSPFYEYASEVANEEERLIVLLLGLIWCASQDEVVDEVSRFLAYLIHFFEPLASRFDGDNVILSIPTNGYMRRSSDKASPELLMKSEFWETKIQ